MYFPYFQRFAFWNRRREIWKTRRDNAGQRARRFISLPSNRAKTASKQIVRYDRLDNPPLSIQKQTCDQTITKQKRPWVIVSEKKTKMAVGSQRRRFDVPAIRRDGLLWLRKISKKCWVKPSGSNRESAINRCVIMSATEKNGGAGQDPLAMGGQPEGDIYSRSLFFLADLEEHG